MEYEFHIRQLMNYGETTIIVNELEKYQFRHNSDFKVLQCNPHRIPQIHKWATILESIINNEVCFIREYSGTQDFTFNSCRVYGYNDSYPRQFDGDHFVGVRALVFLRHPSTFHIYRHRDREGKYPLLAPVNLGSCVLLHGRGLYGQEGTPSYRVTSVNSPCLMIEFGFNPDLS